VLKGLNDWERQVGLVYLMSGLRQNTQLELARAPTERGEAPITGVSGVEPIKAVAAPESPAATMQLMEEVCERENLVRAWQRVRENKGAPGVDGMTVGVEIPKPDGGVRKLGVPCVVDRLIQQALMQVLQKRWDPTFSEHSYGFRPRRSAHQAVAQVRTCGTTLTISLTQQRWPESGGQLSCQ
jgi:RNA-directed DNA polymerase